MSASDNKRATRARQDDEEQSLVRPTPEEDARIQRGISEDPDNPEWTEEDFARAVPAASIMPAVFMAEREAIFKRHRGSQKTPTKVLVSLRLDRALSTVCGATGRG